MKKNDFIHLAIFLVVALLVPPISAFLTSKIIGLESTKSVWCQAYIFFKDQGSFIGGTLAFLGVIFVINSQWKSTTRIIDDAAKRSDMDRFENYKDSADEAIYVIQEMGVRIIPQVGIMVRRGQRFITRETFPEYIFKDFQREYKVVRKFLDRYGEEKTVVIFSLVDGWFKALDNLLRYEGDGEIVEGYVGYLQFCMLKYSMLPKESKPIDFGSAIQGGKKLYFNDIVELSEKLDISDFDGMLLFMEIAYAWIRRHALQQTIVDIDRTLPS